jgi:hypothetical protein
MPLCSCGDQSSRVRSRLEIALARLDGSLRNSARHGEAMESMFSQWQNRWSGRRDDIVRRLEAIDSQLDVWQSTRVAAPRFSVVGAADDARSGSNS